MLYIIREFININIYKVYFNTIKLKTNKKKWYMGKNIVSK